MNRYDTQAEDSYPQCLFDPIDDGNTEEDFFDPGSPTRRYGPSTTCYPERSFVHQGDTEGFLNGQTLGGIPIVGRDFVMIVDHPAAMPWLQLLLED